MMCPSSDSLKAYTEGKLQGAQKQEISEHIVNCSQCLKDICSWAESPTQERPVGVSILGWLSLLSGFSGFLILLLIIFASGTPEKSHFMFEKMDYSVYDPLIWVGMICLGRGLLRLQKWAWLVTTWIARVACIAIIVFLAIYALGIKVLDITIDWGNTLNLVINIIVLYYLTRPKIKEQFN